MYVYLRVDYFTSVNPKGKFSSMVRLNKSFSAVRSIPSKKHSRLSDDSEIKLTDNACISPVSGSIVAL